MIEADALPENLRHLCSYYPSIAVVCRRLEINRQQFNKYLSGDSRPSRHSLRRICDFFGVTEAELLADPPRFAEIVGLRRRPLNEGALAEPLAHLERLYQRSGSLRRYVGYYFRYFYSFGNPGRIMKSLAVISEKDGKYFWKNIERSRSLGSKFGIKTAKYAGVLLYLGDRIFVIEYESLLRNSVTEAILYPSYHTRLTYLIGVQTGAPLARGRKPGASLVLLERLGTSVDVRKALAACGLFEADDPAIDSNIRSLIANRIPAGAFVLETEDV